MAKAEKKKVEDADTDLIAAINAGRVERFQELVTRYQGKLYNFGLKMCGDSRDAEDMVQDTFLNVFKYLKDFRHETKFRNWLYRVATSTCLKRRRKSKYAPDRELSLDEFLPKDEADISDTVPQWAAQPLAQVLNEELAQRLKTAIVELPEKYRLVLVLRDVEGFSTTETADILKLSVANVKVRLHRARLALREDLKGYFKNE
ncbi:MAG: sigma-70 family RNA polymerase sigma factor [Desulfosarcinaceae bacterium]|nr:sigma-70 family RNA polymerase sigma factor [Desulfosarcinaceae bacterium]